MIKMVNINRLSRYLITFCSNDCKNKVIYYLNNVKKCDICGEFTLNKRTCSNLCSNKLTSKSVKKWCDENKYSFEYLERNRKIGEKSKISFKGRIPWNKNLKRRRIS